MKITGIPHVVIDRGARVVACDACRSVEEVGGNLFGFVNVASKFARIHAGCGQKRPVNAEAQANTVTVTACPGEEAAAAELQKFFDEHPEAAKCVFSELTVEQALDAARELGGGAVARSIRMRQMWTGAAGQAERERRAVEGRAKLSDETKEKISASMLMFHQKSAVH